MGDVPLPHAAKMPSGEICGNLHALVLCFLFF